jgi:hypothetical protein
MSSSKSLTGISNDVAIALSETLKNDSLHNLAIDLSETALDSLVENNLLKEIPIIGTLFNITNGFLQIRDQLFLKKIEAFLTVSKKIKVSDRKKMIEEVDNSKKHRLKVGEKLLYILDKCEDWQMAEIISLIFNEFLKGKITYEEFIKISKLLDKLTVYDLERFYIVVAKQPKGETFSMYGGWKNQEGVEDLINSGLFTFNTDEIMVEDEDDWEVGRKYKTTGGELIIELSDVGSNIFDILDDSYFSK